MSPTMEGSEMAVEANHASGSRIDVWSSPQDVLTRIFPEPAVKQGLPEMLGALLVLGLPLGGPNAIQEEREMRRRKAVSFRHSSE